MSTYNIEMNLLNSSSTYDTLYPKVNLSNSQGTLSASQITSGIFSAGDYTIPGNLTLKGSGNYGTKINLGDGDFIHISEPVDDELEIKGKKINFVTSDTSSSAFTWNGNAIGGNSDSILKVEYGTRSGTGSNTFSIALSQSYWRIVNIIYKENTIFSNNFYSTIQPKENLDNAQPILTMPVINNIRKNNSFTLKFFMNLSAINTSNSFEAMSARNLFPKDSFPVAVTETSDNVLQTIITQWRFYNGYIYANYALQANQNSSTYEYYVIGY